MFLHVCVHGQSSKLVIVLLAFKTVAVDTFSRSLQPPRPFQHWMIRPQQFVDLPAVRSGDELTVSHVTRTVEGHRATPFLRHQAPQGQHCAVVPVRGMPILRCGPDGQGLMSWMW